MKQTRFEVSNHPDSMETDGSGWMPIETAPDDDRWVLLYQEGWGRILYGFRPLGGEWFFVDDPEWSEFHQDEICSLNGWREGSGPTHWMPLPTPPAGETK